MAYGRKSQLQKRIDQVGNVLKNKPVRVTLAALALYVVFTNGTAQSTPERPSVTPQPTSTAPSTLERQPPAQSQTESQDTTGKLGCKMHITTAGRNENGEFTISGVDIIGIGGSVLGGTIQWDGLTSSAWRPGDVSSQTYESWIGAQSVGGMGDVQPSDGTPATQVPCESAKVTALLGSDQVTISNP